MFNDDTYKCPTCDISYWWDETIRCVKCDERYCKYCFADGLCLEGDGKHKEEEK